MRLIAITGDIGSGKSVVSQVLRVMGYPVYDCDNEAKRLMTCDAQLITGIRQLVGDEAYNPDGSYNNKYVASCIFGSPSLVASMNALVHPAVLADIQRWAHASCSELCFVETALYRESNMQSIAPMVWNVTAPVDVRIARVARRSNLSETETRARINLQSNNLIAATATIVNDNSTPIIPQILDILGQLEC